MVEKQTRLRDSSTARTSASEIRAMATTPLARAAAPAWVRYDGRGPFDARRLIIFPSKTGVIYLGTSVIQASVSASVESVHPFFNVHTEFDEPPLDIGPEELSRKITCLLSECVCAMPGKSLRIAIWVRHQGGNVIDGANIAVLAAILSFQRREAEFMVKVQQLPITVTFGVFDSNELVVLDPCFREEPLLRGTLTFTVSDGKIPLMESRRIGRSADILGRWDDILRRVALAKAKATLASLMEWDAKKQPQVLKSTWGFKITKTLELATSCKRTIQYISIKRIDKKTLDSLSYIQRTKVKGSHRLVQLIVSITSFGRTSVCFMFRKLLGAFVERVYAGDALSRARTLVGEMMMEFTPNPELIFSEVPPLYLRGFETLWRSKLPVENIFTSTVDAQQWLKSKQQKQEHLLAKTKRSNRRDDKDDLPWELRTDKVAVIGCYIPVLLEPVTPFEPCPPFGTEDEEDAKEAELEKLLFLPRLRDEILMIMLKSGLKLFQVVKHALDL
ncbi:uncharacterized protein LOC9629880 [Selaginella moellendorffii]|uniref:uncharacterized protein LOC9629880 n=1 Tax=Selaginella moellendorffii TaxID=88036 RepID=UPI000D1CE235|nr:uncharacterized protein LOC9629880 [Selaginella moellendorffii]|eukprot:XP_024519510.1 uncharacterized protein LOC9629880 [Selaginella moellendorffii]